MKPFTDIQQSKKLAEILPIETSDMCYRIVAYNPNGTHEYQPYCFVRTLESDIPCWSLASLLDILPKRYNDDNVYMPLVGRYYEGNHKFICGYFGDGLLDCAFGETSVDACVEMIEKLHEFNFLNL